MILWIDGDACPNAIREIVFKRAQTQRFTLNFVANRFQRLPASPYLQCVVVSSGFDAADHHIVEHCNVGDVVITSDIPLAYEVVKKGVASLSPKGEIFSEANIGNRLATRDLLTELRSGGTITGGPPPFGPKDVQRFAAVFDRLVTALHRPS
jgi:uncharacterized protein YaiI (UPF0178 family)